MLLGQREEQRFLGAQARQRKAFGVFFPAVAVGLAAVVAFDALKTGFGIAKRLQKTLNGARLAPKTRIL